MGNRPDESFIDGSQPACEGRLLVSCVLCSTLHRPEDALALHHVCEPCGRRAQSDAACRAPFHELSAGSIASTVRETSPGNFALGYLDGARFSVFYVGRSDSDVGRRLQAWVGAPSHPRRQGAVARASGRARSGPMAWLGTRMLGRTPIGVDSAYTHFAFCYAPTSAAAFERECRDYHELGGSEGLDNARHPQPPQGSRWSCPVHG